MKGLLFEKRKRYSNKWKTLILQVIDGEKIKFATQQDLKEDSLSTKIRLD